MNQRGGAERLGTLVARPVGASIVFNAGTEMEAINDVENGFREATWRLQSRGGGRGSLETVVCDDEGGSGCWVLVEVAVEGHEVL